MPSPRWIVLCLPLLLSSTACPAPAEPPSIVGEPPASAAEISTELACEYLARCGEVAVACPDCATPDGCGGCFAEVYEVGYDDCAAELQPDLEAGFGCADLTPEDEALIDECLASLPDRACIDPQAVEDWANGGPPDEDPRELSEACQRLESLRWACGEG